MQILWGLSDSALPIVWDKLSASNIRNTKPRRCRVSAKKGRNALPVVPALVRLSSMRRRLRQKRAASQLKFDENLGLFASNPTARSPAAAKRREVLRPWSWPKARVRRDQARQR